MISRLAALILLCTVPLTLAQLGGNVTLWCSVSEKEGKAFYWFKQPLGYMVQQVVVVILNKMTVSEQFKSRFTLKIDKAPYSLTIRNISKEDEATYFCFSGATYSSSFVSTFLAVKGKTNIFNFFYLICSVQPGDSVTLQCSLVSRNKEDRVQCPGEHSVHWFRSGSGESHPGFIHTHSDAQEERSCDFSLSKTMHNSSDTGTYYCAVATCGEILFGEGTQVDTKLDPVVLVLGVLLACCLIVIVIFIFYRNQRKVCKNCKGRFTIFYLTLFEFVP
uniref:Ig-like domain-containing protein n=1 Tax=Cyclopterus lumpus TaxID=8103 RepID=A0A8C3A6J2_CYCLU